MDRRKILIVSFTSLRSSRRVYRQIAFLKDKHELHTLGFEPSGIEGVPFYKVAPLFQTMPLSRKMFAAFLFLISRFESAFNMIYGFDDSLKKLQQIKFDLIIVHDIKPFPLVYKVDSKAKILCDAHEYYYHIGEFTWVDYFLLGRFDRYLLKHYFVKQEHIITVNDWLAEQFREKTPAQVEVITSACEFCDLQPSPVDERKVKIIYHGMADKNRKIELVIEAAEFLDDRFDVELMLTATTFDKPYYLQLEKMCAGKKNIRLIPPVDPLEIMRFTNKYDIGLFILPNTYLTHLHALPNKFFEFIQARLMIFIGPNPEMSKMVKQYDLGHVTDDFDPRNIAKQLNSLTARQIEHYKQQSHLHARELSAEPQMIKLDNIINSMLSPGN